MSTGPFSNLRSAVPGTSVPTGAEVSPGGAQGLSGPAGQGAASLTTAPFSVPNVGNTVNVNVVNGAVFSVGETVWVAQGADGTNAGAYQIMAIAGNTLTLLNPVPAPAIPLASSSASGLMNQTSGNTTDFIDGTNHSQNLVTAVQPTIWSARLRSYNAIGNSNFEVDQRNVGVQASIPTGNNSRWIDRWMCNPNLNSGGVLGFGQGNPPSSVLVSGTNYCITSKVAVISLTTAQVSLSAGDFIRLTQSVEGSVLRELISDVHSLSVLAYCTQPLTFSIGFFSPSPYYTLCKACQITTPNQWTLFTLPNLPVFTPSATWSLAPGTQGYTLQIGLGAGSTNTAPANDTWQSGYYVCGPGTTNFASLPANTTLYLGFVQHEPGSQCTMLQDKPFSQNLDECLRYYTKSFDYAIAVGTATNSSYEELKNFYGAAAGAVGTYAKFPKPMAKVPTVTMYNNSTGAVNSVRQGYTSTDYTVSGISNGTKGIVSCSLSPNAPANSYFTYNYSADTGW